MINTLTPSSTVGHDEQKGRVLERIAHEYGRPEEKQREAVKKMGKDEFFKLMINQVQHQDPLKPYENEQMAAQMAQFTALEQMVNVNSNLEKLAQAQQPLQNLGAANLIGKWVTTDSSRFTHTEGKYSNLTFDLPRDANRVRIVIVNDKGENVREIEKTNVKSGTVTVEWDGKKSNNLSAKTGGYLMQVSAVDEREKPIIVKTTNTQMVHGVGFEGKDTVLYAGDLTKPTRILLRDVSRIIDASQSRPGSQGSPRTQASPQSQVPPQIPEEQSVPDAEIGLNAKYTPINIDAIRKAQDKPDFVPPQSENHARDDRMDLSEANLAAQDVAAGKLSPGLVANNGISEVNPAAAARGYAAAAGKSVPSSDEGSVAGKLAE